MKLAPPAGTTWTPADLAIGDAFVFKPDGAGYSLCGVLVKRVLAWPRTLLEVRVLQPSILSDDDETLVYGADEIRIVGRYTSIDDLGALIEAQGY